MQQQYRKKPGAPVKGIKWDGSKEGVHEVAAFLKENDYSIRDILNRDEGVICVTIDCHPAICLHISKQSWILIDSEFNLKVVGGYEFSQTYEPVSAPSASTVDDLAERHIPTKNITTESDLQYMKLRQADFKAGYAAASHLSAPSVTPVLGDKAITEKGWKVWEECNRFYEYKGGVNPYAFTKGYAAGYKDAASSQLSVQQVEGPWHIREEEIGCAPETGDMSVDVKSVITDGKIEIETYDDGDLQSIVDALNASGCQFNSHHAAQLQCHILGYEKEQLQEQLQQLQSEGGLQWVKGSPKERKQTFGKVTDAISNDVFEVVLVPTEGSELWTAYGVTVYFAGIEPDRIVAHLSSTANTEEGYWEVQYKNLWSLYQPLRDKAEEANREPQIAFAEWIDKNEYYKNTYTGAWHKKYAPLDGRVPKVFATSTAELYELFLTEYNKQ